MGIFSENSILVVDDDPTFVTTASLITKHFGRTLVAHTGLDANQILDEEIPDVIILDLILPDDNGFRLLSKIKKSAGNAALIYVVTACDDKNYHLKAVRSGADGFYVKPLELQILFEQIRVDLNSRKSYKFEPIALSELKNVFGSLVEGILVTDTNGFIEFTNQYAENLFGYNERELLGKNITSLMSEDYRKQHHGYLSPDKDGIVTDTDIDGLPRVVDAVTKSGQKLKIDINISIYNRHGAQRYVVVVRDVTERAFSDDNLKKTVLIDQLTGLNTLAAFNLDYSKTLETEKSAGRMLIVMIDIDNFHQMNLFYGHETCDLILQELSNEIGTLAVSHSYQAYRLMGDRFLLSKLSTGDDTLHLESQLLDEELREMSEKIRLKMRLPLKLTSVSQLKSIDSTSPNALLHKLEAGLLNEKTNRGKGKHNHLVANLLDKNIALLQLSQAMLNGLENFNLQVYYQPKVDCDQKLTSLEALVRTNNKDFPMVNVSDFVLIAETNGAIVEIGYFVIREVLEFLSKLPSNCLVPISINLSAVQLSHDYFLEVLTSLFEYYDVCPTQVVFEVTETMLSDDISQMSTSLSQLKDAGFNLSVDDFGTGQSNLRYIHRLPIDELKIDKSFVDDIENEHGSYPLVDLIIDMGKTLQLRTVAEGVETNEQFEYLKSQGCDEFQGYLFYKPLTTEQCFKLLSEK